MKIKVNGEEKLIELHKSDISLNEAVDYLGYKENTVVVELNNLIISSDRWASKNIAEGDQLEIVSIVGGG